MLEAQFAAHAAALEAGDGAALDRCADAFGEEVGFTAVFGLGNPSLAEIAGPIAEHPLRRILRGRLSDDVCFAEHAAHALARV